MATVYDKNTGKAITVDSSDVHLYLMSGNFTTVKPNITQIASISGSGGVLASPTPTREDIINQTSTAAGDGTSAFDYYKQLIEQQEQARREAEAERQAALNMRINQANQVVRSGLTQISLLTPNEVNNLMGTVSSWIQQGGSATDWMTVVFPQTAEYAQAFSGNIARRQAGLPELSINDYIQNVNSYAQIFRQYNVPSDYYNDRNDAAYWIANNVSPEELNTRVSNAVTLRDNSDPNLIKSFEEYYGITKDELLPLFLDPNRGMVYLDNLSKTVSIGAEAIRAGINRPLSTSYLEGLQGAGVSQSQARQAFGTVAAEQGNISSLNLIERNQQLNVTDLANAALGLDSKTQQVIAGLYQREQARFSGGNAGIAGTAISTGGNL